MNGRGFSKEQNQYLHDGINDLFNQLIGVRTNPADLLQALGFVIDKKDPKIFTNYLEHEKFATLRHLLIQLYILYHTPRKSELFKSLPECEDINELPIKKIETFQIDLKNKLEVKILELRKLANTHLSPEQIAYIRKQAIKPYVNTIAEINTKDLSAAKLIIDMILQEVTNEDFFTQLANLLGKTFGNQEAIRKHCETFWKQGNTEESTNILTQEMIDLCNSICNLKILLKTPQNNMYISMCHLKNPDNSGFSKEQLNEIRNIARNELILFVETLKAPKLISVKKWQDFKDKHKKAEAEIARLTTELASIKEAQTPQFKTLVLKFTPQKPAELPAEPVQKKPKSHVEILEESSSDDDDNMELSESFEFSDSDDEMNAQKSSLFKKAKPTVLDTPDSDPDPDPDQESMQFAEECIGMLMAGPNNN